VRSFLSMSSGEASDAVESDTRKPKTSRRW